METPRIHLMRQLFVLALVVAGAVLVFWPRYVPDCSKSGGDGGVRLSMPRSVAQLGLVVTCNR
ncbi:hypothetical protein BJ986_002885 [Phycicoccus badiiscoriae]|uniref:Uncharacterized protein n=1 Tax=Pedococcus badiiscoriae TaxID=642776 RepID=A0A852WHD3_9MICO|nr:hypothetical protein [Pedococcus badiiscoriae]NYG08398.1 hypothetical protein [Pedococcus badiiscoriae]